MLSILQNDHKTYSKTFLNRQEHGEKLYDETYFVCVLLVLLRSYKEIYVRHILKLLELSRKFILFLYLTIRKITAIDKW